MKTKKKSESLTKIAAICPHHVNGKTCSGAVFGYRQDTVLAVLKEHCKEAHGTEDVENAEIYPAEF